jgi:uncharacterized protein (TIGR01777 family)
MRIAVTGASGFIGTRLCDAARARGHAVITVGRTSGERRWDPMAGPAPLQGADAVVHLAGEPVAEGRWSREKMDRIRDSRVTGTRNLVAGLRDTPAKTLVCASATGYYGSRGDEELTEDSAPGADFLAGVCREWEAEAARSGVRTVSVRIGIVLGAEGGALARMLLPFELGLGGRMGSGRQWMSWIHRDDLVGLILHAIAVETVRGPLNGTAPEPARNADFARALGRALHRPALLPVPGVALRFALGQLADEVLLGGQRALPQKAAETGYQFLYPALDGALKEIVG